MMMKYFVLVSILFEGKLNFALEKKKLGKPQLLRALSLYYNQEQSTLNSIGANLIQF